MDFIKKAGEQISHSQGQHVQDPNNAAAADPGTAGAAAPRKEDYGDKAFDFMSKKSGHQVDPNTSEKITDGARGVFEKVSGKQVDPKYSN